MLNGNKLRRLIHARGVTELATALGVNRATVYRWCSGDRTQVAPHLLQQLKDYFGCQDGDLLGLPTEEKES